MAREFRSGRGRDVRGRAGQSNRDMVVALGVTGGLALLLVGGLFIIGPNQRLSEESAPAAKSVEPSSEPAATRTATADAPQNVDQRLAATPRVILGDDSAADQSPPTTRPSEPKTDAASTTENTRPEPQTADRNSTPVAASGRSSSTGSPARGDSAADEKNPRKLLKRARQQAERGNAREAVESLRGLVALVPEGSERASLEAKVDHAGEATRAGQVVDFDSLIELIRSVISPNSWDTVGGAGSIEEFAGGVYVDTGGLLRQRLRATGIASATQPELSRVRENARPRTLPDDLSRPSPLRKVSLPKLEREVARRFAAGERLTDDIRFLAGLREVQYVLVYPDEQDIVIAGPAEGWQPDALGRVVGRDTGRPVMHLDDLVVALRTCAPDSGERGIFGCGIYPRQERLKQVQEWLTASAARGSIEPRERNRWLADLREQLGEQDIRVFGVPAGSRVAQVMVEADYRMKLIGIGLEEAAVRGIPSYFDLLGEPDDARLNGGIDTLRWWFTLNYDAILASSAGDAFELRGSRVQVLSENELLTAAGDRVHTGRADPINEQFARNFTGRFPALAERDVNFADLANIFDLSVVATLVHGTPACQSVGWKMACFGDPDEYLVLSQPAPQTVETVMSHRVYRNRHILAAISGGVRADPWKVAAPDKHQPDREGRVAEARTAAQATRLPEGRWWWD